MKNWSILQAEELAFSVATLGGRAEWLTSPCGSFSSTMALVGEFIHGIETNCLNEGEFGQWLLRLELFLLKADEFLRAFQRKPGKLLQVAAGVRVISELQSLNGELADCMLELSELSEENSEKVLQLTQSILENEFRVEPKLIKLTESMESVAFQAGSGGDVSTEKLDKIACLLLLTTPRNLRNERSALHKDLCWAKAQNDHSKWQRFAETALVFLNQLCKQHVRRAFEVVLPEDYVCILSLSVMGDPVMLSSGETYEKAAIEEWFRQGNWTCPKTGQFLKLKSMTPNNAVKTLVRGFCKSNAITLPRKRPEVTFPSETHSAEEEESQERGQQSPLDNDFPSSLSHFDSLDRAKAESPSVLERAGGSEGASRFAGLETTQMQRGKLPKPSKKSQSFPFPEPLPSTEDCVGLTERSRKELTGTAHRRGLSESSAETSPPSLVSGLSSPLGCQDLSSTFPASAQRALSELYVEASDVDVDVRQLVEALEGEAVQEVREAIGKLRNLAKYSTAYRLRIAEEGGIPAILRLLRGQEPEVVEQAVTTLLNVSISEWTKSVIMAAGAVQELNAVLRSGSARARENAAATLFSLSLLDCFKQEIGASGAILRLVELLAEGTERGRKDACSALLSLSVCIPNRRRMVEAGAVEPLLQELSSPLASKASAIIANLSTVEEGRNAVVKGGGVQGLVEMLDLGSSRVKENAVAALLQICWNCTVHCALVMKEGPLPALVSLSQGGTSRAREKCEELIKYLRAQRPKAACE